MRNLSTAAISRGALRLAIAIPVGYAFSAILEENLIPFMAFAIGVLPIGSLSLVLRQLLEKKLGVQIGAGQAGDQVVNLPGVDASIAERIQEADITTIPQLAWCDPIQLSMRSSLSFRFVVDVVSQALAWVYLGEKLDQLRTIGLRGAYEINVFLDDLYDGDAQEKALAGDALPVAAKLAKCPKEGILYAFDQIAHDPITEFFLLEAG